MHKESLLFRPSVESSGNFFGKYEKLENISICKNENIGTVAWKEILKFTITEVQSL